MARKNIKESNINIKTEKLPLKKANRISELIRNTFGLILNNAKIKVEGVENIAKTNRPIIFVVSPHNGHTDSLFVRKAMPPRVRSKMAFIAAGDYWDKDMKMKILSNIFLRTLPIDRSGGAETNNDITVKTVTQLLAGDYLVIFPEGTRSRDPNKEVKDRKFKTGIIQMLVATINALDEEQKKSNSPVIIPVYLSGAETIMPVGQSLPKFREKGTLRRKEVIINIGNPIDLLPKIEDFDDYGNRREVMRFLRSLTALLKEHFVAVQDESIDLNDDETLEPY